jgi:hypothetical protein
VPKKERKNLIAKVTEKPQKWNTGMLEERVKNNQLQVFDLNNIPLFHHSIFLTIPLF